VTIAYGGTVVFLNAHGAVLVLQGLTRFEEKGLHLVSQVLALIYV
jgi:hypothetical protein